MNSYTFPGVAINHHIPTNHKPLVGDTVKMPSGMILPVTNSQTAKALHENGAKTLLKMRELQNKEAMSFRNKFQ